MSGRTDSFSDALAALAEALGDPRRRAIYLHVTDAEKPRSVSEIADEFGIHPNVARHHLDLLVHGGYLAVTASTPGPSGGRPAKLYQATGQEIALSFPTTNFGILAEMLTEVLQRVPSGDIPRIAFEVGRDRGRALASELDIEPTTDLESAAALAAATMRRIGFENNETTGPGCGYETTHCPFGDLAVKNPRIVCSLDKGLVTGVIDCVFGPAEVSVHPHANIAEPCITSVLELSNTS